MEEKGRKLNFIYNILKKIFIIFLLLVLFISFSVQIWISVTTGTLTILPLFYWIITFGWIAIIFNFNLLSEYSLRVALIIFLIGAFFTVLGLNSIAEINMKISFIFWLIGLGQALIEYKKHVN